MQVQTEITANELSQAISLNRPPNYWSNALRANGYAFVMLVVILWVDIKNQMAGKHVPPVSWALLLIPVLLICF